MIKLSRKRIPLDSEAYSDPDIIKEYSSHAFTHMTPVYRHFINKLSQYELKGTRLLDIGTGTGLLALEVSNNPEINHKIIGLDISPNILKTALFYTKSNKKEGKINYICASASTLPFPDKSIDVIISNASLHHWVEPVKVFKEIKRVLSNQGYCMIRDNMRLPVICSPLIELVCAIKHITPEGKLLWQKAINAGYNIREARKIVAEAGLHKSRIFINTSFLELCITWSPEW